MDTFQPIKDRTEKHFLFIFDRVKNSLICREKVGRFVAFKKDRIEKHFIVSIGHSQLTELTDSTHENFTSIGELVNNAASKM